MYPIYQDVPPFPFRNHRAAFLNQRETLTDRRAREMVSTWSPKLQGVRVTGLVNRKVVGFDSERFVPCVRHQHQTFPL